MGEVMVSNGVRERGVGKVETPPNLKQIWKWIKNIL